MNRTVCVFLAALLLLSFCACAAKPVPAEEPAPAAGESPATVPEPETKEKPEIAESAAPTEEPGCAEAKEEGSEGPSDFAPDFTFRTTDREGNVWDERAFADTSLTMLNFWEPWCGPCVREMPDLQKLAETYADRGFRILGVYSTPGMEEDVDKVLESTGVTYPILHRTADFDLFQSGYVPTTVFVDAGGHVAGGQLYVGSRSYEEWETLVLELLG